MTSVDFLFWLLLALMGGITWAIESGLGHRYRMVLGSSMLASLGSAAIIMFVITDESEMKLPGRTELAKQIDQGDEEAEERGQVDFGGSRRKKRRTTGGAGGGGLPQGGAAGAAGGSDGEKEKLKSDGIPENTLDDSIVYSREPFKDCPTCPEMVIVSVGNNFLGSPLKEAGRRPDEREAVLTNIAKAYAISRLEITRGEFTTFVRETDYKTATRCEMGKRRGTFDWSKPGFEQEARHPVVCVSIRDVEAYLDWLGTKSRRSYILPTENEWEFAARADGEEPYWLGDTVTRGQANFGRTRDGTMPGGVFGVNKFGLSDVIGNAAEMIGDCALEKKTAEPAPGDQPPPCRRLVKGGGWTSAPLDTRHAARAYLSDGKAENFIGFRVMRYVDKGDDHRILSQAEKIALAKAAASAEEMERKQAEAAAKAERDAREATLKEEAEKKEYAATKAKVDAEARAKAEADRRAKFKAEQKKKAAPTK